MLDFAACSRIEEVPTMHATAMRISAMPVSSIDSLSRPVTEPPEASKKGLLLSDRSLSGRSSLFTSAGLHRRDGDLCFVPRNPVFQDFSRFFSFFSGNRFTGGFLLLYIEGSGLFYPETILSK